MGTVRTELVVRVVAWIVIVGVGGVLLAAVVVPRIAGAVPYAVLTGSMEPGLPPGTLVVVRPVAGGDVDGAGVGPVHGLDVGVGSVVTYQLTSGDPTVVTHRVAEVLHRADGGLRLRTRGDANPTADADLVRPEQVRGELWYAVPWVGRLHRLLEPGQRRALTRTLAAGLILYAVAMVGSAWRAGRRPDPETASTGCAADLAATGAGRGDD